TLRSSLRNIPGSLPCSTANQEAICWKTKALKITHKSLNKFYFPENGQHSAASALPNAVYKLISSSDTAVPSAIRNAFRNGVISPFITASTSEVSYPERTSFTNLYGCIT